MDFAHLHVHTEFSLLDGAARIKGLMVACRENGITHIAMTDHGAMYGAMQFYEQALLHGITPILGCEVYVAARTRFDKENQDKESAHLILLAENQEGYSNLVKLVSAGFTEGFYYKPRVDMELLRRHSRGLIALSACVGGQIPRALLDGRADTARAIARQYSEIFGEGNFYIELQNHGMPEQIRLLPMLASLARELNLPLVATNDVHYLKREHALSQEVLMCIQTNTSLDDPDRLRMSTDELYLKSPEEMQKIFKAYPASLENTMKIARRCAVKFDFSTLHLPSYPMDNTSESPSEMLRRISFEGLPARYPSAPAREAAEQRLEYELSMLERMGYVDYFLIVWDFISYAKRNGIVVGPGRGSGAGSVAAYCLGITNIDPLRYSLLFERFLNPERVSMPDFDIDFCYERRQEVIDYVFRKYGAEHVAQIITFGTLAARAAVRDVGRALGMGYGQVDKIAKLIPFAMGITLSSAIERNPELRTVYERDAEVKRLIDIALLLEGLPRHASTHAAGVVISKAPLTDYVPLQKNDELVTTQFAMNDIEKLGLLKIDFLGLRTLTVLRDTVELLKMQGEDISMDSLERIEPDDPRVYALISSGDTDGIFQLESAGMRQFLKELKPNCFDDIIAGISLWRPGPMEYIPRYIEGRLDPEKVHYDHELMRPYLEVTYGVMVYQEQVMQVVRGVAGYSLGRSDIMRRAMAKKKRDAMEKEREVFVEGAMKNGVDERLANKIFDDISSFAGYAFSKSHAAGYALIAYQTAYLKLYHFVPFMAALLNSIMGASGKIAVYISYLRKRGVQVLPPDINRSYAKFSVDGGNIRFSLAAVKNVGYGAVEAIVKERERGGAFASLMDFLRRIGQEVLNKRMVESLIKCGALDSFADTRSQLFTVYERAMDMAWEDNRRRSSGQISLFDAGAAEAPADIEMPPLKELPPRMLLAMEKEMTGVYISAHPLDEVRPLLESLPHNTLALLTAQDDGSVPDGARVRLGGVITHITTKSTRSNQFMAFVTLEDLYGQIELIVFPKVLDRLRPLFENDTMIYAEGKLSLREEEEPKVLLEDASPLESANMTLYLKLPSAQGSLMEATRRVLLKFAGHTPVVFYYEDTKRTYRADGALWVDLCDAAIRELEALLGEDCVKTVIKKR